MDRTARKKLVSIILLTALFVPTLSYIISTMKPHMEPPPSAVEHVLTFPFRPGDYLTLFHTVRLIDVKSNTSSLVESETLVLRIVRPGWPFTDVNVEVGNSSYTASIPTVLLALPRQFIGRNISAPIPASLLGDASCIPLKYHGTTVAGEAYSGATPETCKSLTITAYYYSNGLLSSLRILYTMGTTIYHESYELLAWSTTGTTTVNTSMVDLEFCNGYYSVNLTYTLPGAYVYTPTSAYILYRFNAILNRTPLIILRKTAENNELWKILPTRYVGGVVVVSPLLRDFWMVPHLREVEKYGAVMILPGNRTIYGAGNITRYILGGQP